MSKKTFVVNKNGEKYELVAKIIKEEYVVKAMDGSLQSLQEENIKDVVEEDVEPTKNRVSTTVSVSSRPRNEVALKDRVDRLEKAASIIMDRLSVIMDLLD